MMKLRFTGYMNILLHSQNVGHSLSHLSGAGGESRVPAGGNGSVDSGQVQDPREQQLLGAAGTAQQVWFVPCSEAVPSSLRSPSNTLCAV